MPFFVALQIQPNKQAREARTTPGARLALSIQMFAFQAVYLRHVDSASGGARHIDKPLTLKGRRSPLGILNPPDHSHRAARLARNSPTPPLSAHVPSVPDGWWQVGKWESSLSSPLYRHNNSSARGMQRLVGNNNKIPLTAWCLAAFGPNGCPPPIELPRQQHAGGSLYFSLRLGHSTNCYMVVAFVRWLADNLGKRAVLPMCAEGSNAARACNTSKLSSKEKDLRWTNLSAIWDPGSLSRCRGEPRRPPIDLRAAIPQAFGLTCLATRAEECAEDFGRDPQFQSVTLTSFVRFDMASLAVAWLNKCTRVPGSTCAWDELASVEAEQCHQYVSTGGCASCTGPNGTAKACYTSPCPRTCTPLWNVPSDVFVADAFGKAMSMDATLHSSPIWRACDQLALSPRAKKPADELLQKLPRRFVCVHWRGGDLMTPHALARYNNYQLANSSFVASMADAAAKAVGAEHILLVTNVDAELAVQFAAKAATPVTSRVCSQVPADTDKYACARGSALVLSSMSSFSQHIVALATPGTPYVFMGDCKSDVTTWQACLKRPHFSASRHNTVCRYGVSAGPQGFERACVNWLARRGHD